MAAGAEDAPPQPLPPPPQPSPPAETPTEPRRPRGSRPPENTGQTPDPSATDPASSVHAPPDNAGETHHLSAEIEQRLRALRQRLRNPNLTPAERASLNQEANALLQAHQETAALPQSGEPASGTQHQAPAGEPAASSGLVGDLAALNAAVGGQPAAQPVTVTHTPPAPTVSEPAHPATTGAPTPVTQSGGQNNDGGAPLGAMVLAPNTGTLFRKLLHINLSRTRSRSRNVIRLHHLKQLKPAAMAAVMTRPAADRPTAALAALLRMGGPAALPPVVTAAIVLRAMATAPAVQAAKNLRPRSRRKPSLS